MKHLDEARQHANEAREHVARQRKVITELQRDGHDAELAHELLRQHEQALEMYVAVQHMLEEKLTTTSPRDKL